MSYPLPPIMKLAERLLRWQVQIERFLQRELRLQLKNDVRLRPLPDGIDFLGYVIRPGYMLVRRRVVAHVRETLSSWEARHVKPGAIRATPADLQRVQSVVASYAGHMRHADSFRLRRSLGKRFGWLPVVMRRRRFAPAVSNCICNFAWKVKA